MNNTQPQCKLVLRISYSTLSKKQVTLNTFINEMMTWLKWGKDYGRRYTYGSQSLKDNIKMERRRYTIVFPQLTVEDANTIVEQLRQMKKEKKDHAALRECWMEKIGEDL